jgi:hypothetical protein
VTSPGHGTLSGTGSIQTYTPNPDFDETDTFTFKVNDGTADSNTATVTITVNPVNDAPVAVDDTYSTRENAPLTVPAPGVLGNDHDTELDPLTAAIAVGPTHGTVTLNADGSLTYTPAASFLGTDTFTYVANDGTDYSNTATVTITVAAYIDIKPASCPNPFNLGDKGTISVAIVGLEPGDAARINPGSITLNGIKALRNRWEIEDVATPYKGPNSGRPQDDCHALEGDRTMDLTVKFNHVELANSIIERYGTDLDGEVIYLTLNGQLFDGTPFEGTDQVWIRA